jgi:hypothetical protein
LESKLQQQGLQVRVVEAVQIDRISRGLEELVPIGHQKDQAVEAVEVLMVTFILLVEQGPMVAYMVEAVEAVEQVLMALI